MVGKIMVGKIMVGKIIKTGVDQPHFPNLNGVQSIQDLSARWLRVRRATPRECRVYRSGLCFTRLRKDDYHLAPFEQFSKL